MAILLVAFCTLSICAQRAEALVAPATNNACTKQPKQGSELNIMTYNIGDDSNVCEDCDPNERMRALKDNWLASQSDVIGLQEVWLRNKGKTELKADMRALIPLITNDYSYVYRGHADDSLTTIGQPNQGYDYANMIISRFPIEMGTYKERVIDLNPGDRESQRYFISAVISSPYGKVRVFNIHTRAMEAGFGVQQAAQFIADVTREDPNMPYIILGDFNQEIRYVKERLSSSAYGLNINLGCAAGGSCTTGRIDHIFASNHVIPLNKCLGTNRANGIQISATHSPVLGSIRFTAPVAKTGDFNGDNKVDIFDYNAFLPHFNTTNAKYSLTGDAKVDLFDYNELLKLL